MRSSDAVGRDATIYLTEAQWKVTQEAIVRLVREKVIARNLVPIVKLANAGKESYEWYADVDMDVAFVGMSGSDVRPGDIAALASTSVVIPIIHKDFTIPWRKLKASQTTGETLDARTAQMSGEKVAEKEEELIWAGIAAGDHSAMTVTGLIGSAQSGGTGADWGHTTIATAVTNVKGNLLTTVHALRTDKFLNN